MTALDQAIIVIGHGQTARVQFPAGGGICRSSGLPMR